MDVQTISPQGVVSPTGQVANAATVLGGAGQGANAASALGGEDFFKLLIAQLTHQDPLEPTSNQELLNQISSIREIELSTSLSNALKSLTQQEHFASAVTMIGQYVTGTRTGQAEGDVPVSGVIAAVRFDAAGQAVFELEDGTQLAIAEVDTVMDPARAAESLVGRWVRGVDRADPANPAPVEGLVTGVSSRGDGSVTLELDSGEEIRLSDVTDVAVSEETSWA